MNLLHWSAAECIPDTNLKFQLSRKVRRKLNLWDTLGKYRNI